MNIYPEGYDVVIDIPLKGLSGELITPISVSAKLFDLDELELLDLGMITFVAGAESAPVTVLGINNMLASEEVRSGRILKVEITTAQGVIPNRIFYVIEGSNDLVVMTNSFMSYEGALIEAMNTTDVEGWNARDADARRVALIEAYDRLTALSMRFSLRDIDGEILPFEEKIIDWDTWSEIGVDVFLEFPTHFRRALRRAQLAEANEILLGDPTASLRRSGIAKEKIGESEVTLAPGSVQYGVSSAARSALAGYIYVSNRIARA